MPIDACKAGECSFYDTGSGVFGLILGIAIGVALILAIQYLAKQRGRK
jgi:tetrahydromethanopterin S-methyltransferase subunit B